MNNKFKILFVVFSFFNFVSNNSMGLEIPSVFSNNMVIQQGIYPPIWGKASPNTKIQIDLKTQTKKTPTSDVNNKIWTITVESNKNGEWSATLPKLLAKDYPEKFSIVITNESTKINITNILLGEVWICGGQSNMEWPVKLSLNPEKEIGNGNHPDIRIFNAPHVLSSKPKFNINAKWTPCTPKTISEVTAVGYFFARALKEEIKVPIGLLSINWGGSRAEPWTPINALKKHPIFKERALEQIQIIKAYEKYYKETGIKEMEGLPGEQFDSYGAMYNGMLSPVIPFGIKGAIWYQGESNANEHEEYKSLLPLMIKSWRNSWNLGDFPFGIVQLSSFYPTSENPAEGGWAFLRSAQLITSEKVKNTGLIVTTDIGDANDIHPKNKQDVGIRLAKWALADAYKKKIIYSGPIAQKIRRQGSNIIIDFKFTGNGLQKKNNEKLGLFGITDETGIWKTANASIKGSSIILNSSFIKKPTQACYAWSNNPEKSNLINSEGLPASCFWLKVDN